MSGEKRIRCSICGNLYIATKLFSEEEFICSHEDKMLENVKCIDKKCEWYTDREYIKTSCQLHHEKLPNWKKECQPYIVKR